MNTSMNLQRISVDCLKPAKYNPRKDLKPGDTAYEKIKRSLHEFGYVDPVIWNEVTGNIVGGHQRYKVLTAEGATEIELRIRREGDLAQFSVLDNGAGIEPAVLPKLFEEMFPHAGELRGDGRRSMGIGLSVCMSIVRAHGGTMKAKNRATGGACVSFVLPMGEE